MRNVAIAKNPLVCYQAALCVNVWTEKAKGKREGTFAEMPMNDSARRARRVTGRTPDHVPTQACSADSLFPFALAPHNGMRALLGFSAGSVEQHHQPGRSATGCPAREGGQLYDSAGGGAGEHYLERE
jgi:hypothetical protein